jgi:hypothetical protein
MLNNYRLIFILCCIKITMYLKFKYLKYAKLCVFYVKSFRNKFPTQTPSQIMPLRKSIINFCHYTGQIWFDVIMDLDIQQVENNFFCVSVRSLRPSSSSYNRCINNYLSLYGFYCPLPN